MRLRLQRTSKDSPQLDIKGLKALVQIDEAGSFGEAADALDISISSVSLQIAALEEHLEVKLFDRKSRPPALTDAGLALIPKARKLLSDWEDLSGLFGQSKTQNHIRIGVVHTLVTQLLPSLLKTLSRTHPDLQLRLTTGLTHVLEKDVLNRKLDCALVTMPDDIPAELKATFLYSQQMSVIAHKNARGNTWRELLQKNPYVRFARHAQVAKAIEAELIRRNVSVNSTMEIDTLEGVIALVKNGLGVSIVPGDTHDNKLPASVQTLPFSNPGLMRRLVIVTRRDSEKEELLAEVARVIKEQRKE